MKLIDIGMLRKNIGNHLKASASAQERGELTVIMRRNRPVCAITAITEEEFHHLKLAEDINEALKEIEKGELLSHSEITKEIFGETTKIELARYEIVYAKRVLKDLKMATGKDHKRIFKKLYEKCHFREPFDRHVETYGNNYSEIKAGKYVVVCVKSLMKNSMKNNIQVLCIYPPYGSYEKRFRLGT